MKRIPAVLELTLEWFADANRGPELATVKRAECRGGAMTSSSLPTATLALILTEVPVMRSSNGS